MRRIILLYLFCHVFIGCKQENDQYLHKAEVSLQEGKTKKAIRYLEKYVSNDLSEPYKKPSVRLKLAKLYLKHDPDNESLIRLLEEAGKYKIYEAYALLSELHSVGKILPIDPKKAFDFMYKASLGGDANHLFILGKRLFNGLGVKQSTDMARDYFAESSDNGNLAASDYLCEIYTLREYEMLNPELALKHCQIAMQNQYPRSIHAVNLYQIDSDEKSLIALLDNASKQWIPSHLELVKGLMNGKFEKYRQEISELFKSSMENTTKEFRDEVIQLKALYFRYWQRYPDEANKELALKSLGQACEAQQPMALTDWAILNFNKEHQVAIKRLKLAADQKEPSANAALGDLYFNGSSEVLRNESEALKYLNSACSMELTTSCFQLGILLSESYEVSRNVTKAFESLSFAAFKKHKEALKKALNLSRLNPSVVDSETLKRLQNMQPSVPSASLKSENQLRRPWQDLLDRSKKTNDYNEKARLLDLSRKSLLNERTEGFELNYHKHQIEHESFALQINMNQFETFDQMQKCWDLLKVTEASKRLRDFFVFDGIKVNWDENLKRLERLEQSLKLHYKLQAMSAYEESYQFWKSNFDILDEFFDALINYRRAHQSISDSSFNEFENKLRQTRAELALRLASIDHQMERFEDCEKWIAKARKDNHPIHNLVEGRMFVSAKFELRNDKLAWQLLIDSADNSPHIESTEALPLPGGKAESLLLLSKMVATQRSPKKYWGRKYEYMFLKAASHYQPKYSNLLNKLGEKTDPRLALQAEKLAYRWIKDKTAE